ncbi:hypothetical protein L6272_01115, partial [Microgenomates group bacterium]|nr:hypothetical protein [Microgenomates group bacterium]
RLLKIFFCLTLLFLLSFPALAADSCVAYRPESSALDSLIKEAQARGGAAALVPAPVIKAVYFIEALPYYAAGSFTCKKNQYTALGLWQIVDGEYHSTVPENQQLDNDEYVCQATNCKLSRCNAADAVEIFSRALLGKITLWDNTEDKPLGKIESIADIMYSTGRYYGLFVPDQYTNNLIEYLPQNQRYPSGHQNADTITYPEFICAKSGYCKTYQDYLDRNYLGSTYLDYSGKKSDVPFTFDACGLTTNISPSTTNPLRPNPFELVKEEKNRQISDPNLAPFCAFRPTVVQNTAAAISGTLSVDFRSFITPFLSAPGSTTAEKRYLADYLEGSVFNKLAPASYQDQLKNAMIARASGNADANTINQAYGFPTATTQIHDYEINAPSGKFKLSKLAPKPLDDPDALAIWLNSPTAQAWPYIPMFTREDSKGFIQSLPEPGQVSLPQVTEVIHPHLARTYEVSSTIANLLSPESTHQFQPPDLPINWVQPAPWTTDNNWLDSSQSVPAVFGPVCDPQEPTKVIAGPGEPARGGQITTAVSKSSVTVNPLISTRFSPIYLKTYTPFLDQIVFNLL